MSDTIIEQPIDQSTSEPEATPVPSPGTPQQLERQEIYNRYYGNPTEAAPVVAPAEPAPVEPAAAPSEPAQPVAPTPVVVDENAIADIVKKVVAGLPQPAAPQPTPTTQPAAPASAAPADPNAAAIDWVNKLAAGQYHEGTQALLDMIKQTVIPQVEQVAVARTTERLKAEQELNEYVNSVRTTNPDIIEMEPFMAPKIDLEMSQWVESLGRAPSPSEYVAQYKKVADGQITQVRTILQKQRATATDQVRTVQQEVLSASPVPPNPMAPPAPPAQRQAQTAVDYIKAREAANLKLRGIK